MKKYLLTSIGISLALCAGAQSFTAGNIVVLSTTGITSKASSQAVLKEFTPTGTAGITVSVPTTGVTPFQTAGVYGGSESFLTTSTDGKYLVLGGYATSGTYSDITGTTASVVPRVVGIVYPSGYYLQIDTSKTFYSANDIRGAVSDGTNFWAGGAAIGSVDGIDYFGPSTKAALAVSATPPKPYGLRIFNGQIYYSTQKAGPSNTLSQLGIFSLGTGLPTNGTVGVSQVINTGSVIPQDFSFNATSDVCYIAVSLNTSAGGIQKWTKSGSTWSLAYTLGTGATNIGAYGLVVDYSGTNPVIYATTFEATGNRIIKITDNGSSAAATTLVAATTNVFYKGISFAPSATGNPLVNLAISTDTASEAGATVVTVTANTSKPVTSAQTVTIAVSGTGITSGDYTLSNAAITIANGTSTGSVTFTVNDDILGEGTENATITMSSPSSGISLGMRTTQTIAITDNDGNNHPTIGVNTNTSNYIDGGSTTPLASPLSVSGALSDPTDAASTAGINFTVKDLETPSTGLTVNISSSNTTVVPVANLSVTGTDTLRTLKITPAAVGYSTITVTVNDGTDSSSYTINYAASAASGTPAATIWHMGMSDGSDGIAIDDSTYICGDDELNILNVYSRKNSGLPISSYNYTSGLSLPDPGKPEMDLEAAARSAVNTNRVYWLGSMSNGKAPFDNKPNRDRIFATTLSGTGPATSFTFVGYAALKASLLTWGDANGYAFTASAAAGIDSKILSGFAAEAMSFGPDNTTLYIGMRAPLVPVTARNKALIVTIPNFETWFNNGAPSGPVTFGPAIELNLGGRGLRDMTRLSNGTYIILAGNVGGAPITGAIYKWTGVATDTPILVTSPASDTLNMEGVMQINTPSGISLTSLQVVTDKGDDILYNDGTEAKDFADLNLRKFKSDILTGLDLTMPSTGIHTVGLAVNNVTTYPNPSEGIININFYADANEAYQMHITDIKGVTVYKTNANTVSGVNQISVDLRSLSKGVYVIHINSASINYNQKLIIQ